MVGAHYVSDDYEVDFVVHDQILLACAKSHLSSIENEPIDYIRDKYGSIVGVNSPYWDFVLSGRNGKIYFPDYNKETGEIVWKVISDDNADLDNLAKPISMALADLKDDTEHRTVSDEEKENWNQKLDHLNETGNAGTPIYINKSGKATPINYLNIGTEQGSIILPFFSNDIAFLTKRGGSIRLSGDYTGEPDVEQLFNGKPDYTSFTIPNQNSVVNLDIELPEDILYLYSEKLYIDFGQEVWRANSIKVKCYQESLETHILQNTPYKTIEDTCDKSFWFSQQLSPDEGYALKKIEIEFSNFQSPNVTSGFRISEIGIQRYNSEGFSSSHMSRGSDDPVMRSISPNKTNEYDLGSFNKLWRNIYASNLTLNGTDINNWKASMDECCSTVKQDISTIYDQIDALALGVKLNLSISPSCIYKNSNTPVTITAYAPSGFELTNIQILDPDGIVSENVNTIVKAYNVSENTTLISATAKYKGVSLKANVNLSARYPIMYGFGLDIATVLNYGRRLSARTSATGAYPKCTSNIDNAHFYIIYRDDIAALNSFTMGGAPYVMNYEMVNLNGSNYRVYTSGATYDNGAEVTVTAY